MTDPLDALRQPETPVDPDPVFALRLRARLERALALPRGVQTMTTTSKPTSVPETGTSRRYALTPYLAVRDARRALDWYVDVFGARRRGEVHVNADGTIGHAEIHVGDTGARVVDLGSTNGTFVDGERVTSGELRDGSTITVGRSRLVFRLVHG
jgi:hypothetical protein